MTVAEERLPFQPLLPRPENELLVDQFAAIEAWMRWRRDAELVASAPTSRESRLDLARRDDVVRRQHQALLDWTERQMRDSAHLLRSGLAPRALIVHRNEWFKGKVSAGLAAGGVDVVAQLENGADAVGVAVAEQPDLLLIEDKLPMLSGEDVIREVRHFAPGTVIVAQVANDWDVPRFLDAGARIAYTRRVPPVNIATDVCDLVRAG